MAKKKSKKKQNKSGLDWDSLKDEFFSDLNPDGSYRYVNVEEFAHHVAKGNSDRYKLVVRSIRPRQYRNYEWQGDWASERLKESTKHDAQVKALNKKIGQEFDLLDIGKDVAQTYVPLQSRVDRLFVALDEIYGGRAVLVNQPIVEPSPKFLKKRGITRDEYFEDQKLRREVEQSRRFKDYMRCMSQILRFKRAVDQQLLECLGWNRPQFIGMLANLSKKGSSTGVTTTKVETVFMEFARAQLAKAEMYDMEMPKEFKALQAAGNGHSPHADEEEAVAAAIPVNGKNGRNGHGR